MNSPIVRCDSDYDTCNLSLTTQKKEATRESRPMAAVPQTGPAAPSSAIPVRNRDFSLELFALAALVGLVTMFSTRIPFGHGFEMVALATNLALHGTYANPFGTLPTGPSAANPPLYPLVLAFIMRILPASLVPLAATTFNILLNAIIAVLLPRVSALFFHDRAPGNIASVLWIAAAPLTPAWDASLTVLCLLLFCMVTAPNSASRPILAGGALAGALMLLNPSTLLVILPWLGCLILYRKPSFKQATTNAILILTIAALFTAPWLVRNYLIFGGLVVRTEFGATLYASNNDCAQPSLIEEEHNTCFLTHHPNTWLNDAEQLRDIGEVRFDRVRLDAALAWIRSHPARFLQLTVARIRNFWFPPFEEHTLNVAAIGLATFLSIPGLILMARRRDPITLFTLLALVIFPLMYYLIVSDIRYRYPVLWLTLLPAGHFLSWLANQLAARWSPSRTRDLATP